MQPAPAPQLLAEDDARPWHAQVTPYQWLILVIGCAGWIFDTYENQIFVVTRAAMLSDLLHQPANSPQVKSYGDSINSAFLVGGAVGGVLFGVIADRFGRSRSMILSILLYATFSALTAAAHAVWQVAVFRFLVAMGTGGEWAVAAALVSETFPPRARAHASGIFHASSVLGVIAAGLAGIATGNNWRHAYLLGLLPALLVFIVRVWVRDKPAADSDRTADTLRIDIPLSASPTVSAGPVPLEYQSPPQLDAPVGLAEFWNNPVYRRRALLGLLLAAIGLAGYWGVYAAGQDIARAFLLRHGVDAHTADQKAKFAYAVVQAIGGGVGLFAMGPLCAYLGRRRAFVVMQLAAVVITPIACFAPATYTQLLILLPTMAFFVGGMHAGYAVLFPELFPARLRATGAGLCFNGGRLVAAPTLAFSGYLKGWMDLRAAVSLLALIYLAGVVIVLCLPETSPSSPPSPATPREGRREGPALAAH